MLLSKIKSATGKNIKVRYSVVIGEPENGALPSGLEIAPAESSAEAFYDSGSRLNKRYTFSSFVEGSITGCASSGSETKQLHLQRVHEVSFRT